MKFIVTFYPADDFGDVIHFEPECIGYDKFLELKQQIPELELEHIPQVFSSYHKYCYELALDDKLVLNNPNLLNHFRDTNNINVYVDSLNKFVNIRYELVDGSLQKIFEIDEDALIDFAVDLLSNQSQDRFTKPFFKKYFKFLLS